MKLLGIGLTALFVACNTATIVQPSGDTTPTTSPAGDDADAGRALPLADAATTSDAAVADDDAGAADAAGTSTGDGGTTRVQCTSTFGQSLTATHGRMDGALVSIIAPTTTKGCNADDDHVHLQILIGGSVYDVAVNVNGVLTKQVSHALLDGAWAEGWHPGDALDFVTDLGLHATDFASIDKATATKQVEDFLAAANDVSIFATGYGVTGAHLVHRNGNGNDGALVINPLSATPSYLVFHFPEQTF